MKILSEKTIKIEYKLKNPKDKIDVFTLSKSQMAIARLIKEIQKKLYPKLKTKIKIKSIKDNTVELLIQIGE